MSKRSDQRGVVFDLPSEKLERCLEVFQDLRKSSSSMNFSLEQCLSLPELAYDDHSHDESKSKDVVKE